MDIKTTEKTDGLQTPQEITAGNGAPLGRQGGGKAAAGNGAANGMGMEMGRGGGVAPVSLKNLRTFTSFKSRNFRLFYGSMMGQMAAMNMELIARSYLIYQITHSATILGVMALANSIPMLFLSLYGGVMADRVQKKYLLLIGQLGSAVVALFIALVLTVGWLSPAHPNSWWILIGVSLVKGAIQGFMMPSRSAIIPELVNRDQIMNAVALNNFGMNILRIMAPLPAGILIDLWGFKTIYFLMTGLYVVATIFVVLMPLTGTISLRGRGALADMREGFRYVRHDTTILQILLFTLFVVLCSMPYMQLLPVFAVDVLGGKATMMGTLMMFSGIGAIVGSLTLASLPNKKRGAILLFSSLILGLALIGFSFSRSWSLSVAFIIFVGLGQTGRMTLSNALLQTYSEEQYLGRVMSVYMMEFGLTSFSAFFAGVLADRVGIQWSVGGLAIAMVVFVILIIAFSPRMRKLD
ncbi:MAG: MFS transporter [Dehalococcoidia bacterium]|nr:MFS transporter [Dehalococcoidia bacterium]